MRRALFLALFLLAACSFLFSCHRTLHDKKAFCAPCDGTGPTRKYDYPFDPDTYRADRLCTARDSFLQCWYECPQVPFNDGACQ